VPGPTDSETKAAYLLVMLDKLPAMVLKGEREKVARWLGFIQGVLWSMGEFSINDFRAHNNSMPVVD
jgi:hypothetical protein